MNQLVAALTMVLLVLKLTGLVAISWWWVFAPVLAGVAITLVCIVFALLVAWLAVHYGD